MTLDITPMIPAGRQVIEAYGGGGFTIAGVRHTGSVIVFAEETVSWPVSNAAEISAESLSGVVGAEPAIGILLIGCGGTIRPIPAELRRQLRDAGVVIEAMDTGAACRTFNVLLSEDRAVAAALIATE